MISLEVAILNRINLISRNYKYASNIGSTVTKEGALKREVM